MLLSWNYFNINLIKILLFIEIINKKKFESKQIIYLKVININNSIKVINSDYIPSKVYVNGVESPIESNGIIRNLDLEINGIISITLEWDEKLKKYTKLFRNIDSIIEVDLSDFDVSEVTSIAYMFNNCTNLLYVNFNNFNTSLIRDLSFMFENCIQLIDLDLSCFDTRNVLLMEGMFKNCHFLEYLDLSNFYTPQLNKMNEMFYGCQSLMELDISNIDTSHVTNMSSVFKGCFSLFDLDVSNFITKNVILMDHLFDDCNEITSLDVSHFDTSNVINMSYMFSDMIFLTSLNLSNFNTSKVKYMDFMFAFNMLESIDVSSFDTSEVISMTYMFYSTDLREIDISNFDLNQKYLDCLFLYCESLLSIKFSRDYKLVGSISFMFFSCYSLTSIDLYNFDFAIVDSMEGMFFACNSLTSIDLSNIDTYSLTNMNFAFSDCSKLETINLSNFITSSVKTMSNLFSNCIALTSLDLSNLDTSSVIDMSFMFYYCEALNSLNLSNFDTSLVTNMIGMFFKCKSLNSLDLSNFNTSLVQNMDEMFYDCNNLLILNLSNFNILSIYELNSLFNNTSNLEYIDIYNFSLGNFKLDNFFLGLEPNIIYCLNTENKNQNKELFSKNIYVNCSINDCSNVNDWKKKRKRLIVDKGFCLDNCISNEIYKYEYKYKCYNQCPKGSHSIKDNIYFCEQNNLECKSNLPFISLLNSSCLIKCSTEEFFLNSCTINNISNKTNIQTQIISQTYDDIQSGMLEESLLLSLFYLNEEFIHFGTKEVYHLTTSFYQKNKEYMNVSKIILGECETLLNNKHIKDLRKHLIILKIDQYYDGILIPLIQYEIFNPRNYQKIDLDECKDNKLTINISFPIFINENNIDKYYLNNSYYNDLCDTYTSENGNDITIYDRKNEYNEHFYLCPNNCVFIEIDFNNKKSICKCQINNGISFKKELKKEELIKKIDNKKSLTNFNVFKCFHLLFSKKGLINNYGFYIILFVLIIYIISIFIFIFKEYKVLCEQINNIINAKLNENDFEINSKNDVKEDTKENSTEIFSPKNNNRINLNNKGEDSSEKTKNEKILESTDYEINNILCLFFFSISLTLVINTLFFNDSVLHKIYIDKGVFNIKYFIPQIIYSALISSIILSIIKELFLIQKNILEIKHEKNKFHLQARVTLVLRHLKIKFICFYSFSLLILFLFLFYLSCFCVVYKNTQIYLIIIFLISYLVLVIAPFIIYLLPGVFRIYSFRNPGECLYKISQIIQL